jgi:hypothetical protein
VQLWIALPDRARFVAPGFIHHVPDPVEIDGARVSVFLGTLLGSTSPVATHSPLVGAEVVLRAGQLLEIPVDPKHEHGVLCDSGAVRLGGVSADPGELVFCPAGIDVLGAVARSDGPARLLVLGGAPFQEPIVMWWNFIGRSDEEIRAYRADWERERTDCGGQRYGRFPEAWTESLAAPEMPTVRLRPRG